MSSKKKKKRMEKLKKRNLEKVKVDDNIERML